MRTERGAVVEEPAKIPIPIPREKFDRISQHRRSPAPLRDDARFALFDPRGKRIDHHAKEPREPNAFALPFYADPVHPVVPIAVAEQRQSMSAEPPAMLDRATAMFPQ